MAAVLRRSLGKASPKSFFKLGRLVSKEWRLSSTLAGTEQNVSGGIKTSTWKRQSTNMTKAIPVLEEISGVTGQATSSQEEKSDKSNKEDFPYFRFIYPEFLPDPKVDWRNKIRERLERMDMLNRRMNISLPEFYVGTIMAVSVTDPHALGKVNRFVGICIQRGGCGLRAWFILRNVIDNQGVEFLYDMYCPLIQKVEVLRLEKRLDEQLLYLRDALPEYSTFPQDIEQELLPEGTKIPINPIKVKLKPRPWLERWERQNLQGVQDLGLEERFYKRAEELATPWLKYDLMKQYRETIPEEDQQEIFMDVKDQIQQQEITRKKVQRRRIFIKPKKTA